MQNLYNVFKISIFVIIPLFLISCSSSSYYERYGTSSAKKEIVSNKSPEKKDIVEDEIDVTTDIVSDDEASLLLNKLSGVTGSNKKKEKFLKEIIDYLNTPYRYGGESKSGIDCSAFTQKVYQNSLSVNIPRTAREQYRKFEIFREKSELKFGDLIYFNTSKKYFPGHVGIYLDDNLFAHASSSNGVIVSSLDNIYFSSRFVGANRVKLKNKK